MSLSEDLEKKCEIAKEKSSLPNKPRFNEINNFTKEQIKKYLVNS